MTANVTLFRIACRNSQPTCCQHFSGKRYFLWLELLNKLSFWWQIRKSSEMLNSIKCIFMSSFPGRYNRNCKNLNTLLLSGCSRIPFATIASNFIWLVYKMLFKWNFIFIRLHIFSLLWLFSAVSLSHFSLIPSSSVGYSINAHRIIGNDNFLTQIHLANIFSTMHSRNWHSHRTIRNAFTAAIVFVLQNVNNSFSRMILFKLMKKKHFWENYYVFSVWVHHSFL